jgi:transcriptional regulator with XRE-family HTH domain
MSKRVQVSFAENLHRLRTEAGLSQMELCRKSGISIDSLRNWEQGRVLPRIDAVVKLASALGVQVDALTKSMASGEGKKAAPAKKTRKRKEK